MGWCRISIQIATGYARLSGQLRIGSNRENSLTTVKVQAYAFTARFLDPGQARCPGLLRQRRGMDDKGRTRRSCGSHRATPEAPDGDGAHAVLAGDYGRAASRGQSGIAWLWQHPTPSPPSAGRTQPTHA